MRISSLTAALLIGASFSVAAAPIAFGQDTVAVESAEVSLPSGTFVKKKKKLKGSWEIVQRDGNTYVKFADDFRSAGGPDLKVFLSPLDVATVTGDTAVNGSINLGELQSKKGAQEYLVPAGVDISEYSSVLVHCEQYAILWGGGDF